MKDCKILITGITGMIGSTLAKYILKEYSGVSIIAPVRDMEKGERMFGGVADVKLLEYDLCYTDFSFACGVDYIVHCAAPTSSRFFVEHPLETYNFIVTSSENLLRFVKEEKSVKKAVFLSSLEVYGTIEDDCEAVTEDMQGYVNPLSVRCSYPMAKRAMEHLCCLYAKEYGVPAVIGRLTQTTGKGASDEDERIIVSFCKKAKRGENIVLHTSGESARPYCHAMDAASAIVTLLLRGASGEAYNIANESTYLSAMELALYVKECINPNVSVVTDIKNDGVYAPTTHLRLSTEKLKALGWSPLHGIQDICQDCVI